MDSRPVLLSDIEVKRNGLKLRGSEINVVFGVSYKPLDPLHLIDDLIRVLEVKPLNGCIK